MTRISISSDNDFRIYYEILNAMVDGLKKGVGNPDLARVKIVEIKRELRRWAKRDPFIRDFGAGLRSTCRIVHDYGMDGFIELVSIPQVFGTLDAANEFFKDFIEIPCYYSMYDCTGRPFTTWYKLFERRGQFWAYHRVVFDF